MDRAVWKQKLRGALLAAVPAPFDARGRLAGAAQSGYARWMAQQNVAGVAVWTEAERGLSLDGGARRDLMRSWREALGPAKLIVAAVGARVRAELPPDKQMRVFIRDALTMGEEAALLGADALVADVPAAFENASEREQHTVEYYKALGGIGRPLIVRCRPQARGGPCGSAALLRRLLALPAVVGLTTTALDSVTAYQDLARMMRDEFPDLVLVSGEDRFLGYTLMCGAEAALVALAAAWTGPQVELVSAWLRGEAQRFVDLNRKANAFAEAVFAPPVEGCMQRLLWALTLTGVIPANAAHDPWSPKLPRSQFIQLKRVLAEIC
ncbi:MAG: dihydrodipicolinate synthase family protein [Verrucomicrobiae bacterium]|nr:dihydrodipicolinate synthase family protein [Verrucomicrobiae bacterium]